MDAGSSVDGNYRFLKSMLKLPSLSASISFMHLVKAQVFLVNVEMVSHYFNTFSLGKKSLSYLFLSGEKECVIDLIFLIFFISSLFNFINWIYFCHKCF